MAHVATGPQKPIIPYTGAATDRVPRKQRQQCLDRLCDELLRIHEGN